MRAHGCGACAHARAAVQLAPHACSTRARRGAGGSVVVAGATCVSLVEPRRAPAARGACQVAERHDGATAAASSRARRHWATRAARATRGRRRRRRIHGRGAVSPTARQRCRAPVGRGARIDNFCAPRPVLALRAPFRHPAARSVDAISGWRGADCPLGSSRRRMPAAGCCLRSRVAQGTHRPPQRCCTAESQLWRPAIWVAAWPAPSTSTQHDACNTRAPTRCVQVWWCVGVLGLAVAAIGSLRSRLFGPPCHSPTRDGVGAPAASGTRLERRSRSDPHPPGSARVPAALGVRCVARRRSWIDPVRWPQLRRCHTHLHGLQVTCWAPAACRAEGAIGSRQAGRQAGRQMACRECARCTGSAVVATSWRQAATAILRHTGGRQRANEQARGRDAKYAYVQAQRGCWTGCSWRISLLHVQLQPPAHGGTRQELANGALQRAPAAYEPAGLPATACRRRRPASGGARRLAQSRGTRGRATGGQSCWGRWGTPSRPWRPSHSTWGGPRYGRGGGCGDRNAGDAPGARCAGRPRPAAAPHQVGVYLQ